MGYSPSGRKESDMTERLHFTSYIHKIIYKYIYKIFVKSSNEKYTPSNKWFRIIVKNNLQSVLMIRGSIAQISMS